MLFVRKLLRIFYLTGKVQLVNYLRPVWSAVQAQITATRPRHVVLSRVADFYPMKCVAYCAEVTFALHPERQKPKNRLNPACPVKFNNYFTWVNFYPARPVEPGALRVFNWG